MCTEWVQSAKALASCGAILFVVWTFGYFIAREVWRSRYKAAEADLKQAYSDLKAAYARIDELDEQLDKFKNHKRDERGRYAPKV
jgi:hypothetical protein